ncbi:hypothetical protein L6R50_20400 [Myxococcota bacterium]|nr:hypothetical protein [Myxococcota bacterium]
MSHLAAAESRVAPLVEPQEVPEFSFQADYDAYVRAQARREAMGALAPMDFGADMLTEISEMAQGDAHVFEASGEGGVEPPVVYLAGDLADLLVSGERLQELREARGPGLGGEVLARLDQVHETLDTVCDVVDVAGLVATVVGWVAKLARLIPVPAVMAAAAAISGFCAVLNVVLPIVAAALRIADLAVTGLRLQISGVRAALARLRKDPALDQYVAQAAADGAQFGTAMLEAALAGWTAGKVWTEAAAARAAADTARDAGGSYLRAFAERIASDAKRGGQRQIDAALGTLRNSSETPLWATLGALRDIVVADARGALAEAWTGEAGLRRLAAVGASFVGKGTMGAVETASREAQRPSPPSPAVGALASRLEGRAAAGPRLPAGLARGAAPPPPPAAVPPGIEELEQVHMARLAIRRADRIARAAEAGHLAAAEAERGRAAALEEEAATARAAAETGAGMAPALEERGRAAVEAAEAADTGAGQAETAARAAGEAEGKASSPEAPAALKVDVEWLPDAIEAGVQEQVDAVNAFVADLAGRLAGAVVGAALGGGGLGQVAGEVAAAGATGAEVAESEQGAARAKDVAAAATGDAETASAQAAAARESADAHEREAARLAAERRALAAKEAELAAREEAAYLAYEEAVAAEEEAAAAASDFEPGEVEGIALEVAALVGEVRTELLGAEQELADTVRDAVAELMEDGEPAEQAESEVRIAAAKVTEEALAVLDSLGAQVDGQVATAEAGGGLDVLAALVALGASLEGVRRDALYALAGIASGVDAEMDAWFAQFQGDAPPGGATSAAPPPEPPPEAQGG